MEHRRSVSMSESLIIYNYLTGIRIIYCDSAYAVNREKKVD